MLFVLVHVCACLHMYADMCLSLCRCGKTYKLNKMSLSAIVHHLRSEHLIYGRQQDVDGAARELSATFASS